MQDNWPSVLFAMAGGVALSLGNLSSQYAWAFVGLSVTQVLSCSIIVVIGLYINSILSLTLFISVYLLTNTKLKFMCLVDRISPLGYCLIFYFYFLLKVQP